MGMRDLCAVMEIIENQIVMHSSLNLLETIIHLKWVHFIVCELYLNKAVLQRVWGRKKQKKKEVIGFVKKRFICVVIEVMCVVLRKFSFCIILTSPDRKGEKETLSLARIDRSSFSQCQKINHTAY